MTKKKIIDTIYLNDIIEEGILVSTMYDRLDALKKTLNDAGFPDGKIKDVGYEYTSLMIEYERLETDKEYEARLRMEEVNRLDAIDRAERQEKKEYETYLRLKQKFEGDK